MPEQRRSKIVSTAAATLVPLEVRGCLFHIGQMVWRRAEKAKLLTFLILPKSKNLWTDLHCITALAIVPVNDIKIIFDDLVIKIDSKLNCVVDHIHEYYVHGKSSGRKHTHAMLPSEV